MGRLYGFDINHDAGDVRFSEAFAAGARFVWLKASEGITFVDHLLRHNLTEARAAGLYVGVYHFWTPGRGGREQARNMLEAVRVATGAKTAKAAFRNLLVPCVDVEAAGNLSPDALVNEVLAFCQECKRRLGRGCVVYASPSFVTERMARAKKARYLGAYPLWVAHYGVAKPTIPAPWQSAAFWQYSEQGAMAGVARTGVDLDLYYGSVEGLEKLVVR